MMSDHEEFNTIYDIYDRLDGEARRLHVSPDLLEVTTAASLERARALVNDSVEQGTVTAADLARRTGIKPSAISAFRNNKWKGKASTLAETASILAKAIDHVLVQRAADETSIEGFVRTRFAAAFIAVAKYAMKRNLLGAVTAPAGSGKSMVMAYLEQETPGAMRITVRKSRSAPRSFLQAWMRAMGMAEHSRTDELQDRLIAALTGTSRLVLIDEAHKLQVATLDVIRECHDACRVPILLAGTPSLKTTITSQRIGVASAELMDQFYSRVGIYRDLTELSNGTTGERERLFTVEDIRKVFNRSAVRLLREAEDFLCKLANSIGGGGLRICGNLVQMVVDLYPGESVTMDKLAEALTTKVGPREAGFRMERAGIVAVQERRAAVG